MKREEEYFADQELSLIYIAKRLKEAIKLEDRLTAAGIDYLVEPDTYHGGIIFRSERVGAFFYVPVVNLPSTRAFLQQHGYKPYETEG